MWVRGWGVTRQGGGPCRGVVVALPGCTRATGPCRTRRPRVQRARCDPGPGPRRRRSATWAVLQCHPDRPAVIACNGLSGALDGINEPRRRGAWPVWPASSPRPRPADVCASGPPSQQLPLPAAAVTRPPSSLNPVARSQYWSKRPCTSAARPALRGGRAAGRTPRALVAPLASPRPAVLPDLRMTSSATTGRNPRSWHTRRLPWPRRLFGFPPE